MAEEQPAPSRLASQENAPLVVNLHIVSPSVGVGNLRFPDLPATTTVRQLKAKIRESLESRPADDNQRLIHRGRLLTCETDTLQDVLGEDAVWFLLVPVISLRCESLICVRDRSERASNRRFT
jgi:hypothetical protein